MARRSLPGSKQDNTQMQQFAFVVVNASAKPDSTTRKLIRQHAIRGVAKTRRESITYGKTNMLQYPPMPITRCPEGYELDQSWDNSDCKTSCDNQPQTTRSLAHVPEARFGGAASPPNTSLEGKKTLLLKHIGNWRLDPFVAYPIEITWQIQEILDLVFDVNVGTLKPYRDAYYFIAKDDSSAFHQFLANVALHRTLHTSGGTSLRSNEAKSSHYRALHLANQRIQEVKESVSDGMIATVLMMAAYNHILLDLKTFQMHMDGIEQILKLRGGLETLKTNMRLRLLVSWLDVTGSCSLDRIPRFPLPHPCVPELPNLDEFRSPFVQYLIGTWQMYYPDQPEVSRLMDDLRVFTSLLKAEATWPTGRILADRINSRLRVNLIVKQALCLQAVVDLKDARSVIREAFRLGTLLYLAEIRRQFGVYPVTMRVHLLKLKTLLSDSNVSWGAFLPLKIWVVVMALVESTNDQDKCWFARNVNDLARDLELGNRESLEDLLEQLFWYPKVHSLLLWNNIQAQNSFTWGFTKHHDSVRLESQHK